MINERNSRTAALVGADAVDKLGKARVALFGIGGVGSYVLEALVRAGVGKFILFDADTVSESNINRQLIADYSTVGEKKTDVARRRIALINPEAEVECFDDFVTASYVESFDFSGVDFIVDAIDTTSAKIALAVKAEALGIPMIASMGTGNKLDPMAFEVTDIYKTSVCPLARVMRTELRKRGVSHLTVLYSKEEPRKPDFAPEYIEKGDTPPRMPPASISFVPSAAGLMIASHVVKKLIGEIK